MPLNKIIDCNQSMFAARSGGSCWGIAFLFCKNALGSDAVTGTNALLMDTDRARLVEELMLIQDGIHKIANPMYLRNSKDQPISDLDSPGGFSNQNLVIQLRHNAIKDLANKHGVRCIGTLSSFFEGGTCKLIDHLIELSVKGGIAAVQMDLQQPAGHAVALYLAGNSTLYFFDPNSGLHSASDVKTASAELEKQFQGYTFSFGHVLLRK